MPTVNELTESN